MSHCAGTATIAWHGAIGTTSSFVVVIFHPNYRTAHSADQLWRSLPMSADMYLALHQRQTASGKRHL